MFKVNNRDGKMPGNRAGKCRLGIIQIVNKVVVRGFLEKKKSEKYVKLPLRNSSLSMLACKFTGKSKEVLTAYYEVIHLVGT